MNIREKKEVEDIIGLAATGNFDAAQLRRHVKRVEGSEQISEDSKDRDSVEKSLTEKTVKSGGRSSVSGAVLYVTNIVGVLRKKMGMGLSQDVVFSS